MNGPIYVLKRILYWSYERETWQYDVMCVAILSFIFLIPASVFDDPEARARRADLGAATERFVPAAAGAPALGAGVDGEEVERVEAVRGDDGALSGYRVWTRARSAKTR